MDARVPSLQPQGPLVFISAAEPSADQHGATLMRAARQLCPEIRFVGTAGECMKAAGCEPLEDLSRNAAMLLGAFRQIGRGVRAVQACERLLGTTSVAAAVLIDSPMLHLPLARRIHARNIPVLYYIAPQLWAWGAHRIYRLRHDVDHLAVILPFEEAWFREQGVTATYVGHPSVERLMQSPIDEAWVEQTRQRGSPFVALLPGSRQHVVESVLPGQLAVAERVQKRFPRAAFGVSVASERLEPLVATLCARSPARVRACVGRHHELICAADLVLAASGTTTLDVALRQKPMVVMYNASKWFYQTIGRWLIHTPHLSLPNILAGRRIVPEFMPYYRSVEPIARAAIDLLEVPEKRSAMIERLGEVTAPLRGKSASEETARILLELLDRNHC